VVRAKHFEHGIDGANLFRLATRPTININAVKSKVLYFILLPFFKITLSDYSTL
jgi:hypothetical protein